MKSHFSISEILRRCPSTFGQNGKGGMGGGLFGLREGRRLFVPHGQGVARRKNLDLHQLFMHFQREAITALSAGMLVGGQDELIGQAVAGTAVW